MCKKFCSKDGSHHCCSKWWCWLFMVLLCCAAVCLLTVAYSKYGSCVGSPCCPDSSGVAVSAVPCDSVSGPEASGEKVLLNDKE